MFRKSERSVCKLLYGLGMNRKRIFMIIAAGALVVGWIRVPELAESPKRVIGQTARVGINEVAMDFIARVDTGAASTSLHAESVRVEDGMVGFVAVNQDGLRVPMRMPVARTGTVRNSGGEKERIFVEMTVNHDGRNKRVRVNLNDRSNLTYPLLLGRNWLEDDYLVDVSRPALDPGDGRNAVEREAHSLASQ